MRSEAKVIGDDEAEVFVGADVVDPMIGEEDVLGEAGFGDEECTSFGVVESHAPCGCPVVNFFESAIH